jgi:hypothetical protein
MFAGGEGGGDRLADMGAARHGFGLGDAGFGDQLEDIGLGEERAVQDQRPRHFDAVIDQQQNQVVRCGGIFGQALGQGDADRHFHIAGEAAQDVAHQFALAAVQPGALDAVERRDGEVDFLAAGAVLRIDRELGQPAHVAHVVCGKPHGTPHAFCTGPSAHFPSTRQLNRLLSVLYAGRPWCPFRA